MSRILEMADHSIKRAVENGDLVMTERLLIENKGSYGSVELENLLKLTRGEMKQRIEMMKLILKHDSDDIVGSNYLTRVCAEKDGNTCDISLLMKCDVDINKQDQNGLTPLIFACLFGHVENVKFLLNNGAQVDKGDREGKTPLIHSCDQNKEMIVSLLLHQGANVRLPSSNGTTAVMAAVSKESNGCLHQLMQETPFVLGDDRQWDVPFLEALKGKGECLLTLLQSGLPLDTAGRVECSSKAIEYVMAWGYFSWSWCSSVNFSDVSEAALRFGYCPGILQTDEGDEMSPLLFALEKNNIHVARTFIRHRYFYPEDYNYLCSNGNRIKNDSNEELIDELISQPLDLLTLCLLNVSKRISLTGPPSERAQRVDASLHDYLNINIIKYDLKFGR